MKTNHALILAAVISVLFIIWNTGKLDPILYHVGLNREECGRNLITGAVFCGDELREIEKRQRELRRELD